MKWSGAVLGITAMLATACTGPGPTPETSPPQPRLQTSTPRILAIALDAVPYDTVASLSQPDDGSAPLFPGFPPPVPLISTFPSSTSLAMTGIFEPFGIEKAFGYEPRFFDRGRNRVRGGGLFSYTTLKFSWRTFWDWKAGTLRKLTSGARPIRASLSAIDDALEAFSASDRGVFFAYVDATDLVAHLASPDALRPVLEHLDQALDALRRRQPDRPFYTVLYSDHGIEGGFPLVNIRRPVRRALTDSGYRIRGRIRGPRDVVVVPYGLLSSIVIYTRAGSETGVAEAVRDVDGVDFCVAASGPDRWTFVGPGGLARAERRHDGDTTEWRYVAEGDDPLGYGGLGAGAEWWSDDWWLDRTRSHEYPDALHRAARAFDLVTQPASVLCSLEPKAMFGALATNATSRMTVGRLHWTHGAMRREASYGFMTTDLPGWSPDGALRFDQALRPFMAFDDGRPHGH